MRGFHLLVMMVIGDSVKDTQCGFKVSAFSSPMYWGAKGGGREEGEGTWVYCIHRSALTPICCTCLQQSSALQFSSMQDRLRDSLSPE